MYHKSLFFPNPPHEGLSQRCVERIEKAERVVPNMQGTIMHNFFLTQPDGTTAAERFFGQKSRAMLVAILDSVELPPAPLSPPRRA